MRRGGTIGHLLVRAFERHADAEMLVGDGERLSYGQMAARTARMLRALADLGLGPGRRIALLSRNRIDVLAAAYAGYIGGLCVTPLSPLTSEDDLAFMLADAEIDALIVDDGAFGARGLAVKERVPGLRHLLSLGPLAGAVDLMAKAAHSEPAPLVPRAQPGDLVVIGYTGGTTGRPKGVMHTHASLLASVMMMAAEWEWPAPLRLLAATPVSHAAGVLALPAALLGGSFHMLPAFDADALLDYIAAGHTLTDANAKRIVEQMLAAEKEVARLKDRHFRRLLKVLPAHKAARYVQIENKIQAVVAYEGAKAVPLAR